MWPYIGKRLLLMIPTLLGATLAIFLLMNVIPGDVAILIIGGEHGGDINPQELATLRAQLGLDRPPHERYVDWLAGFVQGDLGTSLGNRRPIAPQIGFRLENTLVLASLAGATAFTGASPPTTRMNRCSSVAPSRRSSAWAIERASA